MTLLDTAKALDDLANELRTAAIENLPRVALDTVRQLKRALDDAEGAAITAALTDGVTSDEVLSLMGITRDR